jgi:cytochrome c oxidase assembly protein Cox11
MHSKCPVNRYFIKRTNFYTIQDRPSLNIIARKNDSDDNTISYYIPNIYPASIRHFTRNIKCWCTYNVDLLPVEQHKKPFRTRKKSLSAYSKTLGMCLLE